MRPIWIACAPKRSRESRARSGFKSSISAIHRILAPRMRLQPSIGARSTTSSMRITLVRSLMRHADAKNVSLTIVTRDGHSIAGTEATDPMMALPIGPCLAGMHEYPNLRCRIVDVASTAPDTKKLARQLVADIPEPAPNVITAYRGGCAGPARSNPCPRFSQRTQSLRYATRAFT